MNDLTSTIALMGAPKKKKDSRPVGRPKMGATKSIYAEIDADLRSAFDEAASRNRRGVKEELSIALEEYLARQGLWPWTPPVENEA